MQGANSNNDFVLATWKLRCCLFLKLINCKYPLICRTYLKLPWRPLISIDGNTVYELNDEHKVRKAISFAIAVE
ncbi:hypothetical protein Patl1_23353 [Pistacia atlantica]|uniref:Uncharacterized protein n=1 Tax=Pistacia atlantica TaxID=434234 RepID=A0ACC0ZXA4_9ROSI|nr:hypothetical protein Patl1_23353 [Pistacia atlantica]